MTAISYQRGKTNDSTTTTVSGDYAAKAKSKSRPPSGRFDGSAFYARLALYLTNVSMVALSIVAFTIMFSETESQEGNGGPYFSCTWLYTFVFEWTVPVFVVIVGIYISFRSVVRESTLSFYIVMNSLMAFECYLRITFAVARIYLQRAAENHGQNISSGAEQHVVKSGTTTTAGRSLLALSCLQMGCFVASGAIAVFWSFILSAKLVMITENKEVYLLAGNLNREEGGGKPKEVSKEKQLA